MSANSSEPSSLSSSAVIPWGQRTRLAARLWERQLMFQVLDNPSLREEILKRAIFGGDGDKKVDHRTACTLRLVDKIWNDSVLRIFWKAHEPLYNVVPKDGGSMAALTKTFAESSTISDPPPPLEVYHYFTSQRTDLESFSNFLTNCGPALLQLGLMHFSAPPPIARPSWTLSRLHKLSFVTGLNGRGLLAAGEQPEAQVVVREEEIPECLVNAILVGATSLAELDLRLDDWSSGSADVAICESINVPPTLVKLKLDMDLNLKQSKELVKSILKCPLPNLTSLSFIAYNDVFAEGILFSLMDKWKSSLKNLVIAGVFYRRAPRIVSAVHFPVMELLEEFVYGGRRVGERTAIPGEVLSKDAHFAITPSNSGNVSQVDRILKISWSDQSGTGFG